jgi:ribonuclease R
MIEEYSELVIYCSDLERRAAEAERDSIKYKQVEYMQTRVGEVYEGIISGITQWGIYVEESRTRAEGMIRLRDLKDDYYEFDEKTYSLVGQRTKKKYRLGDKLKIKVAAANLAKKIIDYVPVK